jgi:uncharacterized protein involved in exopolysaccharide biosynthesis
VESQVEVLRSEGLAEKVIAALKLDTDPEFVPPQLWSLPPSFEEIAVYLGVAPKNPAAGDLT